MNQLKQWVYNPIFRKDSTVFSVWMFLGLLYAVIKLLMGKFNNYRIFEHVFVHATNGQPLYVEYPEQYYDVNHYGLLFAAVIAPFAVLPEWLGMTLWILANTIFLYYAISQLPITHNQKILIYWYAIFELMTAQGVQQFNISIAAIIILTFVCIEKERDFWAAFLIIFGTFIKIYPIVGLAFFFFSKHKVRFILYCLLWGVIFFFVPVLYTPGLDYTLEQYTEWFHSIQLKHGLNLFADAQNVSLLGAVRKISGCATYNDLWLIVPGLILFFIPYLRVVQYKNQSFRLMLLANVLLFVVLFSTGTEASGYVLAMIGVAIWYICSPSGCSKYKNWLFIATLVIVGLSTTELVPPFIRNGFIRPYVVKAWPCILVWLTVCYEMIFLDFRTISIGGTERK
ncbi:MAG: hypothetical protein PARBA_02382 [Parabacteroides sp.]